MPPWITTKEDAEEFARTVVPGAAPSGAMADLTVGELYPRYLEDHVRLYTTPGTYDSMSGVFNHHIKRIFGKINVGDLTDGMIMLYIKTRKGEKCIHRDRMISNRTINKELSYLSSFLTWLIEKGHVTHEKPHIRSLPAIRPKPLVLTFEEVARLILAADPHNAAHFGTLYGLGLRMNEARQLTWEDLDLKNRYAIIRITKTGDPRIVPLPEWLIKLYEAIRPKRAQGHIFIGPRLKRPIDDIRDALEAARIKAGITKKITPHLLRHTFATHMVGLNVNLFKIRDLLGHASIKTTEFYTHIAVEHLRDAQDAMNAQFSPILKSEAPHPPIKSGGHKHARHTNPKKPSNSNKP
jgi:integrase